MPPILTAAKNEKRIRELRTTVLGKTKIAVRSATFRRWLVREYYLVCAGLFLRCRNDKVLTERVNGALNDLQFAVELFLAEVEHHHGELSDTALPPHEFEMIVVSRHANLLLRELARADMGAAMLYMSQFRGHISSEQRQVLERNCLMALSAIKHIAINHTPKTASEIAAELSIQ